MCSIGVVTLQRFQVTARSSRKIFLNLVSCSILRLQPGQVLCHFPLSVYEWPSSSGTHVLHLKGWFYYLCGYYEPPAVKIEPSNFWQFNKNLDTHLWVMLLL